jgi:integrase
MTLDLLIPIESLPDATEALNLIRSSQFCDNHRVFIDPNTKQTYKYADGLRKYVWMSALKAAAVKYRCPYQCRHTFASMMLTVGKAQCGSLLKLAIPIWE